jgi:FkbM family methyltransferase
MIKNSVKRITPEPIWHLLQKAKLETSVVRAALRAPQYDSDSTLPCLVAYNEFGGFCIPKSSAHRPAVQEVLAGRVWERDTIEYLSSHVGHGDIIHAGTYFGDFLPALSSACPSGSKVWAFEPNLEHYRCASITMLLNKLQNVELTNAGLGSEEGVATMVTRGTSGRNLGGLSRVLRDSTEQNAGDTETIRLVSIDHFVPKDRNVSLIQLDVEGYEKEALSGALKTIKRCLPTLILEALPEDPWFSHSILSLGYEVKGKIDENSILICNSEKSRRVDTS